MKKFSFLFLLGISFYQTKAQTAQDQQQLKNIMLQAYESVSQSTRQWLNEVSEKHPAGEFDTSYAMKKLKEKFTPAEIASMDELFVCMIAFQKMMNKEAREDRQVKSHMRRLMLADKAEKLKMQNEAIDQGMKEAREKADIAMSAAVTGMIIGIAQGLIQIGAAASSFSGKNDQDKPKKDSVKTRITAISPKLSVALYLKKLEVQLAVVKKEKN